MKTITPKSLATYRTLSEAEKLAFDASGKPGAIEIRRLQEILTQNITKRTQSAHARRTEKPVWKQKQDYCAIERDNQKMLALKLGSNAAHTAYKTSNAVHKRLKNWKDAKGSVSRALRGEYETNTINYRGNFNGWTGSNYTPLIQCSARISKAGDILTAIIGYIDDNRQTITMQAGRGYTWATDQNGLKILRKSDGADYHIDSDDAEKGIKHIKQALKSNADKRKKAAQIAKKEAAILKAASKNGIYICFDDAIKAGNCKAGTTAFANRHNLDIKKHYKIEQIPTDSDQKRVALAALAAQRRQAQELKQGFCAI